MKKVIACFVVAVMACHVMAQTSTTEVLLETTAGNIRIALFLQPVTLISQLHVGA